MSTSFPCREYNVDLCHCIPALGWSSTSLKWCINWSKQTSLKTTLLCWQSWPTLCSVTHYRKDKEEQVLSSLFHATALTALLFGDSKLFYTHGIADPLMSPRGMHMQTHIHMHTENKSLLCFFLFYSQCYLAAVILRQATPSFHPVCSLRIRLSGQGFEQLLLSRE